jgi:PAS domain S-box-containing protein
MGSTAEIKRLQSCINDLISVLALPAIWGGSESSQILGTLLDVLLTMLRLDFAYARLSTSDAPPIEVVRLGDHRHSSAQPQQFGQALERWLTDDQTASRCVVPDPVGEGEVSIAVFSLGLHESGVLVAGSRRDDFPTEVERLLLRVAANQAGIGLQEARRSGEQKRIAENLEQRVAERTRELTAVNDDLRRSEAYLAEAQRLSHTGSFGWRPSTGEITWSEETFRIFQYDRNTIPTVELVLQRIHPEDAALVKQTIERASQDGKNFEHEYRLLMPEGLVKHVHVVAHAISDDPGSIEFVGAVMDVTEQRHARAALETALDEIKKSQDRLRLVIDTIPAHVWSARADGSVDFINQRALESFGLSIENARGWGWRSILHPDDLERFVGAWQAALAAGEPMESEARLQRSDGEYRWWLIRNVPLRDELGNIIKWYGTAIDIEDRKRAEETLRRSESYLAQAQRLTQSGSWAWNVRTGARFWSQETFRIFGCDPEKVKPTWSDILERVHPEDRPAIVQKAKMETTLKEDSEFDWRIVLPDGRIKHLHSIAHPVMDESGEITEIVGTLMDVTERMRAEALRDGESRILEMIARDAPLEEILEKLVRVVEAQFAGLLCSVLLLDEDGQHLRHGAAPGLPEPYTKAIDGLFIGPNAGSCGTAMYRREPVFVTDILQDPLWEPYRGVAEPYGFRACWSTPILAHSGKALGSFAMYYPEPRSPSPAETRALEMATHLAGIAIERKLAREERERLRQAQADLAHINRVTTMGELTASLAHEIKQPITAAVTNARTCLRWLGRDHPDVEEAREAASRIVKDATRAADIISRISLLFKKGAVKRELVDVNEVIREMIVLLRAEATRYCISVRTELAEHLPQVMVDRVQLQQVLMNLVINGIDAMKDVDGKRELAIKSQRRENEQLQVSVSDTGPGLPPQQADQIFDAFFTTKADGTGMGLRISRSIIETHGGRLWVADNPRRGARFCFTLPTKVEANE